MEYSQLETIRHLEEQITGLEALFGLNKMLRSVGIGSKRLEAQAEKIDELRLQLKLLTETPTEFNRIFSDRGWISHDSLDHKLMLRMIELAKTDSIETAENEILEQLKPENIHFQVVRLKALPELRRRWKFLDHAKEDYGKGRYYSVVPILLMIIDGTVNDVIKKGFHSDKANLDAWDAITNIDGGIEKIRSIFARGRYVTREEEIDLPYRNGILHGMDLGYDNYVVAAKCWHFLFVVRDWALSKKSANERRRKFEKEKNPPPILESIKRFSETRKEKAAIENWTKREFSQADIDDINNAVRTGEATPETTALRFLSLWSKHNYGYMADLYWSQYFVDAKPNVRDIRDIFSNWRIESYRIDNIEDQAAGITEIYSTVTLVTGGSQRIKIRLVFEGEDGNARARNFATGNWKVVFIQESETI